MQITIIPLERLSDESKGINFYLNAEKLRLEERDEAVLLFGAATECLEEEIEATELGSTKRREILELLVNCYDALCVEASLLPELRRFELPYNWHYYIDKACQIREELDNYELLH